MKRPSVTSSTHPVLGIAVGAVAGTALLVGGIFISHSFADQNVDSSVEQASANREASDVSEPSSESTPEASAPTQSTATSSQEPTKSSGTPAAPKTQPVLVADVSKWEESVFTTPQGLHCGLYGKKYDMAYCRMQDRTIYSIPENEESVCAVGDNVGELYIVNVDTASGWGCTTEPDPEPVLTQSETDGVFYEGAIDWYKSSPFPAAVKGTKAAQGKAYVPVGGVVKAGDVQCEVLDDAVQCVNTSTKAGFLFTNKSVKFAKERVYPGEQG